MIFLCYSRCSTCKKAEKWLDENNLNYEIRDIKTQNPSYKELKKWYKLSGLPIKRFFNTSGQQYRELGLKDKLKDMSEEEQLILLSTDGMLVKRPILICEEGVLVGFKENEWAERLKGE